MSTENARFATESAAATCACVEPTVTIPFCADSELRVIATAARAEWNARPLYEPSGTATSPSMRGRAPLPRTRTFAEKLPSRYFTGIRSALRTSSTSPIGTRAPRSYASAFAPLAPMPSTRPAKSP